MVATVTRLSAAATTVHYFEVDGYYAKNDPEHRKASRWHGEAATLLLGLHGPVKPNRFESVLAGYVPGTDLRLGRLRDGEHQHRPGVDVTFSAPKSVSLEALVYAAPKTRARVVTGARRGGAAPRWASSSCSGAAPDPELRPADGSATKSAGRRHGGSHLPPPGEPQPGSATAHPCGDRQHDARPGRGLAQRRVHLGGTLEAAHRGLLPQRAPDPARGNRLRHGADAGGPDAGVRDRGLPAADAGRILDPAPRASGLHGRPWLGEHARQDTTGGALHAAAQGGA